MDDQPSLKWFNLFFKKNSTTCRTCLGTWPQHLTGSVFYTLWEEQGTDLKSNRVRLPSSGPMKSLALTDLAQQPQCNYYYGRNSGLFSNISINSDC